MQRTWGQSQNKGNDLRLASPQCLIGSCGFQRAIQDQGNAKTCH